MKTLRNLLILSLLLVPVILAAQGRFTLPKAASLPATCNIGDMAAKTTSIAGSYVCVSANTWAIIPGSSIILTGFPDGTSGAPSIFFTNQTSLGFYRPASGFIGSTGHFEPSATGTFDLGSQSLRWRYLYSYKDFLGDDATVANNVVLRHQTAFDPPGRLVLTIGDESSFGDLQLRQLFGFAASSYAQNYSNGAYWHGDFSYGGAAPTVSANGFEFFHKVAPTADVGLPQFTAGYFELDTAGSHNYGGDLAGVYGSNYLGNAATPGSGNYTAGNHGAVIGDAEYSGTGTITNFFSFGTYCCSFDPSAGTLGVIAHSGFFHATQPFQGATSSTIHSAIWIEDQTEGGGFTPGTNYMIEGDTASGTEDFLLKANGDLQTANIKLSTAVVQPTCAAGIRGTFWYVTAGAGVKDNVQVCAKDAANAYAWRVIY